jgi:hypothetical protein
MVKQAEIFRTPMTMPAAALTGRIGSISLPTPTVTALASPGQSKWRPSRSAPARRHQHGGMTAAFSTRVPSQNAKYKSKAMGTKDPAQCEFGADARKLAARQAGRPLRAA